MIFFYIHHKKLSITLTISLHQAVFLTKLMVTQQVKKFPASVKLGVPLLYSPEPTLGARSGTVG
jgi:hypothetical protein